MTSSPEGRQDVIEEMKWFDQRGGLAIGMHEALRRWIAALSALPAPVAAAPVGVKDLQARLWNASGELAAHGGFDNHCRTLDEAAEALALIAPAKPAVDLVEALQRLRAVGADCASHNNEKAQTDIEECCGDIEAALQAPATPDAQTEVEK